MSKPRVIDPQEAPLTPSVDYKSVPRCSKCGGHSTDNGDPCGGMLEIPVRTQGHWYRMGYACDACAFGNRLYEKCGIQRVDTIRFPYPRLSQRDLTTLWLQVSCDTPTLADAARKVQDGNGRERILSAVENMMQAERIGSWDA